MSKAGWDAQGAEFRKMARECGYKDLTPLQEAVIPAILDGRDVVVSDDGARGRTAAFLMALIRMYRRDTRGAKAVVLTTDHENVAKTFREYRRFRGQTRMQATTLSDEKDVQTEARQLSSKPDIIIGTPRRVIDHIRRTSFTLDHVETVVVVEQPGEVREGFRKDVAFIAAKMPRNPQTVIFSAALGRKEAAAAYSVSNPVYLDLARSAPPSQPVPTPADQDSTRRQESSIVSNDTRETIDKQAMRDALKSLLKAIKEDEDPAELNRYRSIVKRNVPIFMRSYLAAYLFKKSLDSFTDRPSEMARLFVSIGKNRRVFPRDLSKFFMNRLELQRSEIGEVKVLDNFSFIDISLDHAQTAISKLSGVNFRGRRITVNLARKRNDGKDE